MQHVKYAWDSLFLFVISVSAVLLLAGHFVLIDPAALQLLHAINLLILAGYYFLFIRDLRFSKNKLSYCKQHWVLLLLLILPLVPFARLLGTSAVLSLGQNIAWVLLDEAGML